MKKGPFKSEADLAKYEKRMAKQRLIRMASMPKSVAQLEIERQSQRRTTEKGEAPNLDDGKNKKLTDVK
ncbi:hypothetical protein LCGC14_0589150 [marine sediment metagenome]|uniref:Uncharacterized protein n=1 Tax=marine sediment metagenome TaxID=412755 RepID=A0A0F9UME4_9ZZZZ